MKSAEAIEHTTLQRQMIRGSMWTVGLRWSLRLTGLVNIIILARLLTPGDFGIVAIATMIVGMVEIFTQAGQTAALIRHPNPTRDHYDSAWTISVLLGLAVGVLILAFAPITTAYFREPRAHLVVEILAFRTMISGAQNIAVLNFRRNLQFDKQFWFSVTPSFVALVVTVGAAIVLKNYWALVIGLMAEQVAEFVLSYAMEPYRPRFRFNKIREIRTSGSSSIPLSIAWRSADLPALTRWAATTWRPTSPSARARSWSVRSRRRCSR
jgi:O-antigen/teichoic acid export membrane protein